MMKDLTIRELAELFLAVASEESDKGYANLNDVAQKLGIEDRARAINIAYYLEFDKLVYFKNTRDNPSIIITSQGAHCVKQGGKSGIIVKYREQPNLFLVKDK